MPKIKSKRAPKVKIFAEGNSPKDATTRAQRIANLVDTLNGKDGVNVYDARTATTPWLIKRRPTGLASIDYATHGGFPAGGIVQIYGKKSLGKSTLVNEVIAENQKLYNDNSAIYMAITESGGYNKASARRVSGVQVALSDFEIECGLNTGEIHQEEVEEFQNQVGSIILDTKKTVEEIWDDLALVVASNDFQIVVVDSIGAFISDAGLFKSALDKTYGHAGVNTVGINKLHAILRNRISVGKGIDDFNQTTVFLINQYRDNLAQANPMYTPANEIKLSGGNAIQHGSLMEFQFVSKSAITATNNFTKEKELIGFRVNWEIRKNKAGGPEGSRGTEIFIVKPAINEHGELVRRIGFSQGFSLLNKACELGLIEKSGAWYSYNGDKLGQGEDNVATYLENSDELYQELYVKIIDMGKRVKYGTTKTL